MLNQDLPVKRPLLTYFGGKFALAPWILDHLPPHRVYVEPFGGAGSVLLRKPRSPVEIYNDLDGEIVNLFRVVQDPTLARALFKRIRHQSGGTPVDRAVRVIVRSHMSFNAAALFEKSIPFSCTKHKNGGKSRAAEWANYPRHLASITARLRGVMIENRPAAEVIERQDSPGTLFYVDPPYLPATRSSGRYRCDLTPADHRALLEQLKTVQGMVVLSGYPPGSTTNSFPTGNESTAPPAPPTAPAAAPSACGSTPAPLPSAPKTKPAVGRALSPEIRALVHLQCEHASPAIRARPMLAISTTASRHTAAPKTKPPVGGFVGAHEIRRGINSGCIFASRPFVPVHTGDAIARQSRSTPIPARAVSRLRFSGYRRHRNTDARLPRRSLSHARYSR